MYNSAIGYLIRERSLSPLISYLFRFRKLSNFLGVSTQTVKNYYNELEKSGFINNMKIQLDQYSDIVTGSMMSPLRGPILYVMMRIIKPEIILETGVASGAVERIPLAVEGGQYVYIRVTEENGQDNLIGEGEDVVNNDTGDLEADGKRDDSNDSAWTSPIWFESQVFVWSKNSDLYHDPDCWAVSRIGAANRRSGAAPAGKTKHNCHP